ncbi:transcriptional regulator [Candidatus Woesearchaeota archaeon]|nr:transcriptional regulator [Candidatus Woesearchaeota archaeon]
MIELTDDEKKVVEAMKELRAISEEKLKTADHIAKEAMMPKGLASNVLLNLVNKKIVKRVTRGKAAGYYVIESMLQ